MKSIYKIRKTKYYKCPKCLKFSVLMMIEYPKQICMRCTLCGEYWTDKNEYKNDYKLNINNDKNE